MREPFTPAEEALLQSIEPPPLSVDFVGKVMAQVTLPPMPLSPKVPLRPDRRSGWRRARPVLFSGIAIGLLSMGAAASSLLGIAVRDMPVIGYVVEKVASARPKPVITPPPKTVTVSKPMPAIKVLPPIPAVEAAAFGPASPPVSKVLEGPSEARAGRVIDWLERRAKRRQALGQHPYHLPPRLKSRLRERLKQLSPEERQEFRVKLREMRMRRRQDSQRLPEAGADDVQMSRRFLWRSMSPEQRRSLRRDRFRRRVDGWQTTDSLEVEQPPADAAPK